MPPAFGIMAASSPYESAAATVTTAANSHATSSQPGLPILRAISAETMKMPEPIMAPITIMVESKTPSSRTKPASLSVRSAVTFSLGLGILALREG